MGDGGYGIGWAFIVTVVMGVIAYGWIEIHHRGIKERNRIRRKRLAEGKNPETGEPL